MPKPKIKIKMNKAGMRKLTAITQGASASVEQAIQDVRDEMAGQPSAAIHRELMSRVRATGVEPNSANLLKIARQIEQAGK